MYRNPKFLDWIADTCLDPDTLEVKLEYPPDSRILVKDSRLHVIFLGHESLPAGWLNTFPLHVSILAHARFRREARNNGIIYGVLGTDHMETVSERLDNLINLGHCDNKISGNDRGSNVMRTIKFIVSEYKS